METLTDFIPEAKRTLISLIDHRIEERLKYRLPTREDFEELFTLLFGFRIHLDARQKAKKEGVHLFVSYGKEL